MNVEPDEDNPYHECSICGEEDRETNMICEGQWMCISCSNNKIEEPITKDCCGGCDKFSDNLQSLKNADGTAVYLCADCVNGYHDTKEDNEWETEE